MIIVEAEGLACPFPVVEAKKALRDSGAQDVVVRVDNEVAVANLKRLAESMQRAYSVDEVSAKLFEVTIGGTDGATSETSAPAEAVPVKEKSEYIAQISSKYMGDGDDGLGAVLMKGFIYSLTEQDQLPAAVVFYNAGVELTCTGSPVLEDLKTLEQAGVSIISCGTCLDFLKIKDRLAIGEITNMYTITEMLRNYFTVRP